MNFGISAILKTNVNFAVKYRHQMVDESMNHNSSMIRGSGLS